MIAVEEVRGGLTLRFSIESAHTLARALLSVKTGAIEKVQATWPGRKGDFSIEIEKSDCESIETDGSSIQLKLDEESVDYASYKLSEFLRLGYFSTAEFLELDLVGSSKKWCTRTMYLYFSSD